MENQNKILEKKIKEQAEEIRSLKQVKQHQEKNLVKITGEDGEYSKQLRIVTEELRVAKAKVKDLEQQLTNKNSNEDLKMNRIRQLEEELRNTKVGTNKTANKKTLEVLQDKVEKEQKGRQEAESRLLEYKGQVKKQS